jgi:polyisoprenoid-binding protein YceI
MKFITVLFLLTFSMLALAEGKVTFHAGLTPAGSFDAVSSKLKGNVTKQGDMYVADKLSVLIESFKTGIVIRDEHTWKHFNYQKHPKATLYDLKAKGGKAVGVLEVNGVKKPVSATYETKGDKVIAKFTVKASSFNLPKASYLGVGVNDDVAVTVEMPNVK